MIIGTELLLSLHPKTKPLISATQRDKKAEPLNGFVLHNYSTIKELLLGWWHGQLFRIMEKNSHLVYWWLRRKVRCYYFEYDNEETDRRENCRCKISPEDGRQIHPSLIRYIPRKSVQQQKTRISSDIGILIRDAVIRLNNKWKTRSLPWFPIVCRPSWSVLLLHFFYWGQQTYDVLQIHLWLR